MPIPLQFASLYDGQEVFAWSDCLLHLGTDLLVGNAVFATQALLQYIITANVRRSMHTALAVTIGNARCTMIKCSQRTIMDNNSTVT